MYAPTLETDDGLQVPRPVVDAYPGHRVRRADHLRIVATGGMTWLALAPNHANALAYPVFRRELLGFAWALLKEWWRLRPSRRGEW